MISSLAAHRNSLQNREHSLQSLNRSIVYPPSTFHTQLGNSRNHQHSQQPKPQTRIKSKQPQIKQAKHPANTSELHSAERARRAGDSHCGPSGLLRNTLGAYPALTGLVRPRKQADAEAGRRRPTEGPLPKTQRGPQGQHPPAGLSQRFRRASAHIEKRPPRARRPALPQPSAAVLSAKAGLTAGFGMGPGDPRLCGRARGGRSPAAQMYSSLPGTPVRGDPGGRMAGTAEDGASRSVL